MKKIFLTALYLFICPLLLLAQHDMNMSSTKEKPIELIEGYGNVNFKVTTSSKKAQDYFNQGLAMTYAFNHGAAISSFKRAAQIDPSLAMAYWGIAYANGININDPVLTPARMRESYKAVKKALSLSKNASKKEKDFINALMSRYSKDSMADQVKLNTAYKNAMEKLYNKYPDDLDAAVLFAESAMDLKPWQLWGNDGRPAEGTLEIEKVLEYVLSVDSNHIGANHFYIHTMEASPTPEKAYRSAVRLKTLAPAAGHLVHMPAHILFRIGDFEGASEANLKAINRDTSFLSRHGYKMPYVMYYYHNIDFLSASRTMEGKYKDAMDASYKVIKGGEPFLKEMPFMDFIYISPVMIMSSFGKWNDLLALPSRDTSLHIASAMQSYGKGLAYASLGNINDAQTELNKFMLEKKKVPADAMVKLSGAYNILNIAMYKLQAKIAQMKNKNEDAVAFLNKAVDEENYLSYDEPPDWFVSIRPFLGAALIRSGKHIEAESIFREDLKKNPKSPWSLFGLAEALKLQGKTDESFKVEAEFSGVWRNADTKLDLKNF
jgi:tetratricopeptide (TPR) repeat protein